MKQKASDTAHQAAFHMISCESLRLLESLPLYLRTILENLSAISSNECETYGGLIGAQRPG